MVDLARNRIEWLDPLFRFLNYFDTPYFFFVLIPVVWLGFSYKWGLRIFYWFSLNGLIVQVAKNSIGWNRPSTDMPGIGFFHPQSYGFPSGGAQTAMFLGGIFIYYWRTRLSWIIGLTYILLISFSRLYLGVHYPLDILGGWILAWILLALFVAFEKPLERWLIRQGLFFCFAISLLIPLTLLLVFPKYGYILGAAIGISLGSYISLKNRLFLPPPLNLMEGVGRSFIGIATLFLLVLLLPGENSAYQSFSAALFMSLAASPICKLFSEKKFKI